MSKLFNTFILWVTLEVIDYYITIEIKSCFGHLFSMFSFDVLHPPS